MEKLSVPTHFKNIVWTRNAFITQSFVVSLVIIVQHEVFIFRFYYTVMCVPSTLSVDALKFTTGQVICIYQRARYTWLLSLLQVWAPTLTIMIIIFWNKHDR